jgi:hypothetical protein
MPKPPPAPNPDDHAIVVGIAHYPGLLNEEGQRSDLDGPVTDATAIRDWLLAADGGGLAEKNVAFIASSRRVKRPRSAKPTLAMIQQAFRDLQTKTKNRPGRRLYVYMSGHGFAPDEDKGALFTAECEADVDLPNVWATEYVKWFRAKQRFSEFVLWMDCCCDQDLTITPLPITFPKAVLAGKAGPRLLGIAAQTGMKAAEAPMPQDNGRVHGVFTWTLLNGLKNAIGANEVVTGESLRDYLLNSMQDFLPEEAKAGSEVSLQPYVFADRGIVFGRKKAPATQAGIRLAFPASAVGKELRIWTGNPPRIVAEGPITQDGFTATLDKGVYVAEVAASRLRHGFEITGSTGSPGSGPPLEIAEPGEPVAQPLPERCVLDVKTGTKAAAIHLIDSSFGHIAEHAGFFAAGHKPGVYKLRVQYGREVVDVSEKIILLDRDMALTVEAPALKSPVPIGGTAYTHEFHIAAAHSLETRTQTKAAQLGIMGRFWTGREPTVIDSARYPHPLQGLSLLRADGTVVADAATFEATEWTDAYTGGDPVATLAIDVEPGIYFLRQRLASGRILERTLVASQDWRTNLFIRRDFKDIGEEGAQEPPRLRRTGSVAMLMTKTSAGHMTAEQQRQDQLTMEAARLALKQGRRILDGEIEEILYKKFDNPIMGILGAHLLIMETLDPEAPKRPERIRWLNKIVPNLRTLLGDGHPDVEALSLLCPNKELRAARAVTAPPIFVRSWDILLREGRTILPSEIANRARARTAGATYLNWAVDQRSQGAFTRSLSRQIKAVASIGKLKTAGDLKRKYPEIAAVAEHSLAPRRIESLLQSGSEPGPPKRAARASR